MTQIDQQNVPKLRFPGFEGEWSKRRCDFFLQRESVPVSPEANKTYREIGIRSHGKGVFHKAPVLGASLGDKRVFKVVPNTLALNIVFAWEQAIAVLSDDEEGFIASHRFPMFSGKPDVGNVDFFKYLFLRPRGKWLLELASPGGAGRNKTLGQSNFSELKLVAPTLPEQRKIAGFLGAVDTKIAQLAEKKRLLEDYKKGCMQQLFSQKIRFKDNTGNDFPDWEEKRLGDVLTIGSGRDYKHLGDGDTPVYGTGGLMTYVDDFLHEGESVCIGRKGTIDKPVFLTGKFWTVDTLFYTHSFKNALPRFIYAVFQQINWQLHNEASGVPSLSKSTIERLKINLPHPDEQRKIADFLSALDHKIDLVGQELAHARTFKQGLLQQMFV